MPALQSSPGHDGATGPLPSQWSLYAIPRDGEMLLPDDSADTAPWWSPAQTEEPAKSDAVRFDLVGQNGVRGIGFVPDLAPQRLPGPVQFVLKLMEFWRIEDGDAVRLLGFDEHDAHYVASILAGGQQFRGRDVRERIGHLFRIRSILSALFRDRETENGWLRERHSLLHDRAPIDLMLGGSMEDLLLVRDYVERAAGW